LSRPGRFDVHAAFYDATREQAIALFKHFYPTSKLDIEVPTVLESGEASAESSEKADSSNVIDSRSEAIMTDLADQFANAIFSTDPLPDGTEVAVSMAALQGYLLKHKKQPRSAAAQAREWVKGELETVQRERVEKRLEKMNLAAAEKEAKAKKDELAEQIAQAPLTPTSVTS
jgi:chaperone BCS1